MFVRRETMKEQQKIKRTLLSRRRVCQFVTWQPVMFVLTKVTFITVINVPDLSSETLSETGNIRKCPVFESLRRTMPSPLSINKF